MTMTEDQIIAEAEALAMQEQGGITLGYTVTFARHYHALKTAQATQPEQDPALVKAMAVWDAASGAYCMGGKGGKDRWREAAARKIMDAYPAPSAELLQWARETLQGPCRAVEQRLAIYILTMAGEKQ